MPAKTKKHIYYSLVRPPYPENVPDGWLSWDAWAEKWGRLVEGDWGSRYAFGTVTYSQPLPVEQIRQKELLPADLNELACYMAWQQWGPDQTEIAYMLQDYQRLGAPALQEIVDRDLGAWIALQLLGDKPAGSPYTSGFPLPERECNDV